MQPTSPAVSMQQTSTSLPPSRVGSSISAAFTESPYHALRGSNLGPSLTARPWRMSRMSPSGHSRPSNA